MSVILGLISLLMFTFFVYADIVNKNKEINLIQVATLWFIAACICFK